MESPYYEMTHDFEEENRLFQSGYVKGYHDAVMKYPEIVRCKDCKHLFDGEHIENCCDVLMKKGGWLKEISVSPDWFCADGERR